MPNIEEQIKEVEEEIKRTEYNKKTQHHIGRLKAKLARLRELAEARKSAGGASGKSYAVKKSGHATVALVGFPSVGKSTLLNKLTGTKSAVASYHFTTLTCIPGLLEYKGAKIQILDLPGLIKGAAQGRGRGREVLSVVRNADLILFVIDSFEPHIEVLVEELAFAGVRLNQRPADIAISKTMRGGLNITSTVKLTKIETNTIENILREYDIVNADVVIREDITEDQLIDHLAGNRTYIPGFVALNKIDIATEDSIKNAMDKLNGWKVVKISSELGLGCEELKEEIFKSLKFIRVYLKPQGKEADMKEPLVIKGGSTVGTVCDILHRDFRKNFRYAMIWGKSAKFPGQMVGLEHTLMDEDILTIVIRR